MVDIGMAGPSHDNLWLAQIPPDGRVTIPVPLVSKLSWLDARESPVDCLAVLTRVGHMIVTPMIDTKGDPVIRELLVQRRGRERVPAPILSTDDAAEVGRRLRILSTSISTPPPSFRLQVPRILFPMMGVMPKGGPVYVFESGGRLKLSSIESARREVDNWPMDFSDLT